jgi:hypothetical protein
VLEGLDKLTVARMMTSKILGLARGFIASYSPVSAQDVKNVACKVLESTTSRNVLRTAFGFTAWTCAVVGVANTDDDGAMQKEAWDIFGYVDPLIGTMNGGMDGPESFEQ